MTAFWVNKSYYELTLFNNEIVAFSLSNKKGEPNSYHIGLAHLISKKEENYKGLEMILHTDHGSVYSSKKFNESLHFYNIILNYFFITKRINFLLILFVIIIYFFLTSANSPL